MIKHAWKLKTIIFIHTFADFMFYQIPLTRRGNSAEDCLPECWQQNSQMVTSRADSVLTVSSIGKWSRFLGSYEANLVKTALCPKGGTLPLRWAYVRTYRRHLQWAFGEADWSCAVWRHPWARWLSAAGVHSAGTPRSERHPPGCTTLEWCAGIG